MDRNLIRQDDYVLRRTVFRIELIDPDIVVPPEEPPAPFGMAGCTIRTTWKTQPTDPNEDPDDADAPIRGDITFDADGTVTSSRLLALPPGMSASDGVLHLTMDSDATLALPLATTLRGDMQVTDGNGEHLTIPVIWTVTASDGFTNRTEVP